MRPLPLSILVFLATPGLAEDLFWLTAELMHVDWRKGCLTTAGCADPRFQLTEANSASNEKVSISWSILDDFTQERSRSFVTHWKRGYPTDVTITCEVIGIDPTYGFPRICDATGNHRIFQKELVQEVVIRARGAESLELEEGKMVVELKGKCFNASLTVEKHEERCPWCEKREPLAFVAHTEFEHGNSSSLMHYFGGGEQLLYVAVTLLAGIAIISTAAFACLLLAFIRQKRVSLSNAKRRVSSFPTARVRVEAVNAPEDNRYEMPWDQKYRPLPHWLSHRSELNSSSPNESASSNSGPLFYQTSRTTIGGATHYESPTTSLSDRHDDSGLDSV